jgi:hypothetical protein
VVGWLVGTLQGRNQDLNLTKQKYEILTGHIRIVAKNVIK